MKMKMSSFIVVNEIKRIQQVSEDENQISGKFYFGHQRMLLMLIFFYFEEILLWPFDDSILR